MRLPDATLSNDTQDIRHDWDEYSMHWPAITAQQWTVRSLTVLAAQVAQQLLHAKILHT